MSVYSERYKYIFFANPQTGSKAISKTLLEKLDGTALAVKAEKSDGKIVEVVHHATWQDVQDQNLLTRAQLDQLLKVTGIRNPWDMMVSRYLKRKGWAENMPESKKGKGSDKVKNIEEAGQLDFNQWIDQQFSKRVQKEKEHPVVSKFLNHADMFIRFEHLQGDFDKFVAKLGTTEKVTVEAFNVTSVRVDGGKKRNYTEFYNDASREVVGKLYAAVIDKFGYKFG